MNVNGVELDDWFLREFLREAKKWKLPTKKAPRGEIANQSPETRAKSKGDYNT